MQIEDAVTLTVQAGKAPIIDGDTERLMRVGCGSAAIGMFAKQWFEHVDEVVVVDDHITGILSEHQAGKELDVPPTGIRIHGRRSTPGRYFQVANPGTGWGGTDITDPLTILKDFKPDVAWPGLRMMMVSTTGEQYAYFGPSGFGRTCRGELRAVPLFRSVYGWCWGQLAGGCDGKSGRINPFS
jgi:hypothetical protein